MTGANLEITAEWPGEACRLIEQITGGRALYFNGACGNINPTWIEQRFDEVYRVGSIVGAKTAALSQELRPLGINHQAANIRWDEFTDKPVRAGRLVGEVGLRAVSRTVQMPYRRGVADAEMVTLIASLEAELRAVNGVDARRATSARLTAARMERLALMRTRDKGSFREEEVQALRLGEGLFAVCLPGEVFVETQEEIRQQSGLDDLLVITYANDYPGYFCRPEAVAQGGYEVGVTPFAPEADGILIETAVSVLREVSA